MFQDRRRVRTLVPALLAAVAYVDPGNFGVDLAAGIHHGHLLILVVLAANAVAGLVQYLSACLGMATGESLPAICRARYRPGVRALLWIQAEVVVVMTDVAEIIGGALALQILFGWPLLPGAVFIAVLAYAVTGLRWHGGQLMESVVLTGMAVIVASLLALLTLLTLSPVSPPGGSRPTGDGSSLLLLSAGIVGATVMPHAVHVHSAFAAPAGGHPGRALTRRAARMVRRHTAAGVAAAMVVAGGANAALVAIGAALPAGRSEDLAQIATFLSREVGPGAGVLLGGALLASGIAATVVGVHTGQVVTDGFIHQHMPDLVRRGIGVFPPLLLLALGIEPTQALILSQVVLSATLAFTLVPLLAATSDHALMGALAPSRPARYAAGVATAVIALLNIFLLARLLTT